MRQTRLYRDQSAWEELRRFLSVSLRLQSVFNPKTTAERNATYHQFMPNLLNDRPSGAETFEQVVRW